MGKNTKPESRSQLKTEVMLQVNQHLYDQGVISRDIYQQAKDRIVSSS